MEISKPDYTYLWSSGGSIVAPSNVKVQTGWTAEVPPFQWENWSQNRQDQAIAHVLQHGISSWDAVTEYQAGKSYVQGSDGLLYKARTTHTNVNPVTDTSFVSWTKAMSGGLLNVQKFTSTATYTPTPGTTSVVVEVFGAGGGGGSGQATGGGGVTVSGAGGGGGYAVSRLTSGFSGVLVQVGAGGTGGTIGASDAGTGGSTSFGGLLTATGGTGGDFGVAQPTNVTSITFSGVAGTGSGGNLMNSAGSKGVFAIQLNTQIIGGAGGHTGRNLKSGGDGLQLGISQPATAGNPGNAGLVLVWEYA